MLARAPANHSFKLVASPECWHRRRLSIGSQVLPGQGTAWAAGRCAAGVLAVVAAGAGNLAADGAGDALDGCVGDLAGDAAADCLHLGDADGFGNTNRNFLVADLLLEAHLADGDAFGTGLSLEVAFAHRDRLGDAFADPVALANWNSFVADRSFEAAGAHGDRFLADTSFKVAADDRDLAGPAFPHPTAAGDGNLLGDLPGNAAGDGAGDSFVTNFPDITRHADFALFDGGAPDFLADRPTRALDGVGAIAVVECHAVAAGNTAGWYAGIRGTTGDDSSGALHGDGLPVAGADVDGLGFLDGPTDRVADVFLGSFADAIPFRAADRFHVRLADGPADGVVDGLITFLEDRFANGNADRFVVRFEDGLTNGDANFLVAGCPDGTADLAGNLFVARFEDRLADGEADFLVVAIDDRTAAGVADVFIVSLVDGFPPADGDLFADGVIDGFAAGDLARFVNDFAHGLVTGGAICRRGIAAGRRAGRGRTAVVRPGAAKPGGCLARGRANARAGQECNPQDGFHESASSQRGFGST